MDRASDRLLSAGGVVHQKEISGLTVKIKISIDCPSDDFAAAVLEQVELLEAIVVNNCKQERKKRMISPAEQALLDRLTTAVSGVAGIAQQLRDLQANPPADDAEFDSKLDGLITQLETATKAPVVPEPTA